MSTLILLTRPPVRQELPISRQDVLMMQQFSYETLVAALRRLHPKLHRSFLIRVLTIALDMGEGLDELPTASLAELLFCLLDSVVEPKAALGLQNIMCHVSHCLEAAYGPIQ